MYSMDTLDVDVMLINLVLINILKLLYNMLLKNMDHLHLKGRFYLFMITKKMHIEKKLK